MLSIYYMKKGKEYRINERHGFRYNAICIDGPTKDNQMVVQVTKSGSTGLPEVGANIYLFCDDETAGPHKIYVDPISDFKDRKL